MVRDGHLPFEGINKVVRWPGAAQEQLDGLLGVEVTSGAAEGFDGSARHEEIKGQQTAPVRIRECHLAANVEAGQGSPKVLHQQTLVQGCSVQAQITLSLGCNVGSAGITGKGKGLGSNRPCIALRSRSGTVEENMETHLPQALEFVEKRAVFIAVPFQQPEGLGCVFKLTSIPHGDYGQVAIQVFDDRLVGKNL
jgi:hypothetical protein